MTVCSSTACSRSLIKQLSFLQGVRYYMMLRISPPSNLFRSEYQDIFRHSKASQGPPKSAHFRPPTSSRPEAVLLYDKKVQIRSLTCLASGIRTEKIDLLRVRLFYYDINYSCEDFVSDFHDLPAFKSAYCHLSVHPLEPKVNTTPDNLDVSCLRLAR